MAEVGSLSAKLTLDKSSFSSALAGAKGDLAAFGATAETGFSKLGTALGKAIQVGAAAAVVALGTVTAALGAGTKAFAAYEAGLADVGRVSGANAEQLDALGDSLRKMAIQTGSSVTDLEKLSVNLSAAGVEYENLADGTKLANSMMVAYGTNADKTGGFVGNLMKTYKMGTDDVRKFGSAMNVIEGAGKATPDYMMDYVGALSELNAMFDIDMKKAMAFGGVFADSNIQASEAATSLSSAISYALAGPDQEKPKERIAELTAQFEKMGMTAKEAKEKANLQAIGEMSDGNERMTKWANLLGVSYEELTKMLNTDFMGTMNKSAMMIGKITDNTKRLTVTNDIWGRYGTKSIAAVSGSIANYGDYIDKIETDIINGSKSMEAEETRVYGTLSGMFKQAQSTMNDFGITVGEVTQGPLKDFLKWFLDSEPIITESLKQALSGDLFGAFTTLRPMLDDVANGIVEAGNKLRTFIGTIDFNSIFAQLQSKLGSIDFGSIWSGLIGSMGNIGEQIVGVLGKSLTAVLNYDWESVWDKVYPSAKAAFSKVGEAILSQPWGSWASRAMDLLGKGLQAGVTVATDVGKWILDKINAVGTSGFVEAGRKFAGWVVDGLSKIATLVKDNWATWIAGGIQFVGTIVTAVASFAWGIVSELGKQISSKASEIWEGIWDYGSSVTTAAGQLGSDIITAIGSSIRAGAAAALQPIVDGVDAVIRSINYASNAMGKGDVFSEIGQLDFGGSNWKQDWSQVGTSAGNLWDTATAPISGYVNKQTQMATAQTSGITQYQGDPEAAIKALMAQGKGFDEAFNLAKSVLNGSQTMSYDYMKNKYGMSLTPGNMAGLSTGMQGMGGGSTSWVQAANGITGAPAGSAYSASGGILDLLNQGKGNSIVPGTYGVSGPVVVDGTKVFVTNWPAAFGSGGSGSAMGCAVQSVDYGFGDNTKFTGNITPGGPGIGMVGSASSTSNYADRLNIDTCEIDSFGMTPGLGAELARSGAWKPIQGSPVSEKLAAEIGYQGNYSNVGQTAMIGSIKTAYDRAQKSQIQTQNKVNTSWESSVAQTANTNAQLGMMVGNHMVQSATFGANISNNASTYWGTSVNYASAAAQAAAAAAGQSIIAGGTMGGASINIAGSNLGGILSSGGQSISTGASNLVNATAGLTNATGTITGLFSSQTSSFNTLMGSLNATALGLTTMGANMGIPMGGIFMSGGGGGGGTSGTMNWGGMTSISGGGGWVGTGVGATTLNKSSPYYASWGGAQTSYNVQQASKASATPSYTISNGTIKIGKYAEGGMVTKPQIAMIGESGREAVLPNKLVETIMSGVNGGSGQMLHATINVDGKRLADVVGPAVIKRVQQGSGLKVR